MRITERHVLALFALVCAAMLALSFKAAPTSAAGPFVTNIGNATTSTQVIVSGSTRVLATTSNPGDVLANYSRVYASICNPSANPVYLRLDGDKQAASSTATTVIAAAAGYNVCYEIRDYNAYNGSVQASSTVTNTFISVEQHVQ